MKKYLSKIIPVFVILWIFLYTPAGVMTGSTADQNNVAGVKNETVNVGYLENVLFEKLSGRERLNMVVSQQPLIAPPSLQQDGSLLISLENMFAPDNLRGTLGRGQLLNVNDVRVQQRTSDGKQWVDLKINLKETVPYSVRQEGKVVLVDFNTSGIETKLNIAKQEALVNSINQDTGELKQQLRRETIKRYTDRIISADFQDADIKSVLRLLSEYGNVSIISGDDVKGNVTLTLKQVPWEQALDSILDIKGLTKRQTGDVISVMTLERRKKEESDKKDTEERDQQILVNRGKLRQILIEAKIVEASDDFVRDLGVQLGFDNSSSVGSYGLGATAGTNPFSSAKKNYYDYPPEIQAGRGVYDKPFPASLYPLTMAAVNMPTSLVGPTLGLVFGNARGFIEAQLSALESTTQGKIISSPRVVTMDNVKAVIKQGEEVPYVTPASGTSPATVTFKEAVLRLEVKPKITKEGRISMEIKATNDTPDYARGEKLQGNPPIRKNEVESKIVVQDGDTVVIGGVSRNQEDKIVSGVPWFYKIPVLGWLFKTENITRQKRQLLIFVTPKILSESGYVEDECDTTYADKLDKCRNR